MVRSVSILFVDVHIDGFVHGYVALSVELCIVRYAATMDGPFAVIFKLGVGIWGKRVRVCNFEEPDM